MIIIHQNFIKEKNIKYKIINKLIKKRITNYSIHLEVELINYFFLKIIKILKVAEIQSLAVQKVKYLLKINKIY